MNLIYNNFALHDLGDFSVSQTHDYEAGDGDAPQRVKVTLRVVVDVFRDAFADNYGLFLQLKEALRTQHGVLQWRNTDVAADYVNQTAQLTACDLPEDPNGWGSWHQQFNLTFVYYEQALITNNLPLTLLKNGNASPFVLGNVRKWAESAAADRFSPLFSTRRRTGGKIAASGFYFIDPTTDLASRRAALIAYKTAFDDALDGADGVLSFGPGGTAFQKTVRIEEYTAEIDQAINAVAWSFSAGYTAFPDEANFATAEYTVDSKDGQTGEQFLTLAGKIVAPNAALALARLNSIRNIIVAQYGYEMAQVLREDSAIVFAGQETHAGGLSVLPEGGLIVPGGLFVLPEGGLIVPDAG